MRIPLTILLTIIYIIPLEINAQRKHIQVNIFGDSVSYTLQESFKVDSLSGYREEDLVNYAYSIDNLDLQGLSSELIYFKQKLQLDDWMYYQVIRKAAEQIAPKSKNYILYTLYKWYFLSNSGYDAILTLNKEKLLFYINCSENIYNIPIRMENNKQYVCLNYHDYGHINFNEEKFKTLPVSLMEAKKSFSYSVNKLPEKKEGITEKQLQFNYNNVEYSFRIKLDPTVAAYFRNYPTMDYEKHFNIPLSHEAYNSLIPTLKSHVKKLSTKAGVDFLMHFTRYAFLFKSDTESFGKEKRLSPEMTLFSESSDCEDRVSLFYYLIKEIYDLPMIVMVYPKHVSIAVHFDKNYGKTVEYNGKKFSICDPTPQELDLTIGESLPSLKHESFQVAFAYEPKHN